ncbi:50S ribosomal protein L2 [Staphylothermus hellenicus]|uniref:Large ribosomal subunit protein uL2 n=1 Tax=Staphylothermus hellenicus (strain DSM 12710 / JCM 10830 / BK20S6-10-b1 / P8) TaxID=591019 RepID=D7D9T6_STAHD|nr:50S ribosomal protein L2 [Staphylothermus hellenicus]ADI32532.1 ribosomal protein L2 [Staphylothermus hellenicus DSM 12710]
MGKRILPQRMGRGTPTFRSPSHRRVGPAKYPPLKLDKTMKGKIIDLVHDPGRWAPLAKIALEDGTTFLTPAVEGMYVGQIIEIGPDAHISNGNILPIGKIPEGTQIANIEKRPGDGGKFVRSSGTYALIVGRAGAKTQVQLPSGKIIEVPNNARATIGVIAGGGRPEKPLLKAGNAYHKWKVKAKKWPKVRGVAMNAVSHPHGGGSHQHVGKPSTVARETSPGRKVGHIAARRTGRRKG